MRCSAVLLLAIAPALSGVTVENARFVVRDAAGNAYVAGNLGIRTFESLRPLQEDGGIFLIKIGPSGGPVYATPLGAARYEHRLNAMCAGPNGDLWLATTYRSDVVVMRAPCARVRPYCKGWFIVECAAHG